MMASTEQMHTSFGYGNNGTVAEDALRPSSIFPLPLSFDDSSQAAEVCPFPSTRPHQFPKRQENVVFDPKIHLDLCAPETISLRLLKRDCGGGLHLVDDDNRSPREGEDLAFTDPFPVLSPAGVAAMRDVVDSSEREGMVISTARNPKIIRGLGYTSDFIRSFNECPELLQHLSMLANAKGGVSPHPVTTHYSQINYGYSPSSSNDNEEEKKSESAAVPADVWHMDSTDYVLVTLLSDNESEAFTGGELLVSEMDPLRSLEKVKVGKLPEELTRRIPYPRAGWGIFMQGSRIAHAVSPVTSGGPRITCVNSYNSCCPSRVDLPAVYPSIAINHAHQPNVFDHEYLRSVAWRCRAKLDHLITHPNFTKVVKKISKSNDHKKSEYEEDDLAVLDLVIEQLTLARRILRNEELPKTFLPSSIT